MPRSYALGLIPLTVTLTSFAIATGKANALTSYDFSIVYDTVVTIDPSFRPDVGVSRVTVTGETTDAPFGLTNFVSNTYGRLDPATNVSTFNADPTVFGLDGLPVLGDRYFGGSNELFGTANDRAAFDLEAGTVSGSGIITLTGGTGLFADATGSIAFTQNDRLTSTDLTEPFRGQARLDFTFQTPAENPSNPPAESIPEPSNFMALPVIGALWFGLRRRMRKLHKAGTRH
jgi:hypothetical protein